MSLLSAKIPKRKRLSFTSKKAKQSTEEPLSDIEYSRLIEQDPIVEDLVVMFDLVDSQTGRQPQKVDLTKYREVAFKILPPETSATKDQIEANIAEAYKVSPEKSKQGFKKLVASGAIEPTLNPNLYYLSGSTPF